MTVAIVAADLLRLSDRRPASRRNRWSPPVVAGLAPHIACPLRPTRPYVSIVDSGLRPRQLYRGNAALRFPARLSALRIDLLCRARGRPGGAAAAAPDRGSSLDRRAPADRRRAHQRQSEAQQCVQGLARCRHALDRDARQQRADAARLYPAAVRGLRCQRPVLSARRRSAACRPGSGPSSNAPFSTIIRRAGNISPTALGIGFAQGKTMFWRRDDLERAGGIRALGNEAAEDAASTKIVRRHGIARAADAAAGTSAARACAAPPKSGSGSARWARLRRASFPLHFAPEIFSGGACARDWRSHFAARQMGYSPLAAAACFAPSGTARRCG